MSHLANTRSAASLRAADAAHHLHPFTENAALGARGARIITGAKGVWLTDDKGNQILDAMAGLWCVNIGYGREELARVAAAQMRELPYYNTFFNSTHQPATELAERIAALTSSSLNHVFFASSGSEANDTNIRLVRTYWQQCGKPDKQVIVSRHNAYHGSSMGSASLGGMAPMHAQGGLPIPGITHIGQPDWWAEGGDLSPGEFGRRRAQELETAIDRIGEGRVAAFIAEPVQGAGGVIVPPDSYWPEIQRICDEREILLIADEVICGFGRTGKWFGSETFAIRPDIMTIAKGLSSGYQPVAASVVSDKVAATISREEFFHGYTWSGHPVAAAVALKNLRILDEEGIVTRVGAHVAPYLADKWLALAGHSLVGEARICGLMGSIALTPDKASRAAFAAKPGAAGLICRERALAHHLVMRHVGDRMVISPPLVITHDEVDALITRALRALDDTLAELAAQGLVAPHKG